MRCSRGKRVAKQEDMSLQHSGAVRLFSPNELLHLFGFPDSYSFPPNMTTRQKYRAIGQSINKIVVQMLMHSELCRHANSRVQSNKRDHNSEEGGEDREDAPNKKSRA